MNLRKFNPMLRAVGVIGVVAGLATAVTFATITSNTVSLTGNTLSAATASLEIGGDAACATGTSSTGVAGMNFNNLVPGGTSDPFPFCIKNTGGTPLALSAVIPGGVPGGALGAGNVTLNFTCGVGGADNGGVVNFSATVSALTAQTPFGASPINNTTNNVYSCHVSATLAPGTYSSGATLNSFSIDFAGTVGS